jgi:glutathione S-transferase
VLELFQAEWCPFSAAVRELLTERGIDFVVRQVEPWPEEREELRRRTGSDAIPALVTEDGRVFVGTRAIFPYLETLPSSEHAAEHRRRFHEHRHARDTDVVGRLVERSTP